MDPWGCWAGGKKNSRGLNCYHPEWKENFDFPTFPDDDSELCLDVFSSQLSSWVWAWPQWLGSAVTLVISQETSSESAGDTELRRNERRGDEMNAERGEDEMVMAGTCSTEPRVPAAIIKAYLCSSR